MIELVFCFVLFFDRATCQEHSTKGKTKPFKNKNHPGVSKPSTDWITRVTVVTAQSNLLRVSRSEENGKLEKASQGPIKDSRSEPQGSQPRGSCKNTTHN